MEMEQSAAEQGILAVVGHAVGLWIDFDAVEDLGGGRCRIARERLAPVLGSPDGFCVVRNGSMPGCREQGDDHLGPIGTGVLLGVRPEGASVKATCMATAGHLAPRDPYVSAKMCLIVGLVSGVSAEFEWRQVMRPGTLLHYEHLNERDLAILKIAVGSTKQTKVMKLPSEEAQVSDGEILYVVGHESGRDVRVFSAKVVSRVLSQDGRRLRSFNVSLAKGLPRLSGCPVFRWTSSDVDAPAAELLGIVQGPKLVFTSGYPDYLIRRLLGHFAHEDRGKLVRLFAGIETAFHRADLEAGRAWVDGRLELEGALRSMLSVEGEDARIVDSSNGVDQSSGDASVVFFGGALSGHYYPR